jgi:hypothetical protein
MIEQTTPPFEQVSWAYDKKIEEGKWKYELNREDAKRAHDSNRDFHTYVNKIAMENANLALRTLVIINGGAAIAVLGFLGAIATKTGSISRKSARLPGP